MMGPSGLCRMFNANVKQVINVSQVVASKMIAEGKKGSIVNVSSQVKTPGSPGRPHSTHSVLSRPPKLPWPTKPCTVPPRELWT